jgi:hypothetical protein
MFDQISFHGQWRRAQFVEPLSLGFKSSHCHQLRKKITERKRQLIVFRTFFYALPENAKANGREPKRSFGRVFNFKLGSFAAMKKVHGTNARKNLKSKTRSRFCLASLSLFMALQTLWVGQLLLLLTPNICG